MADSSFDWWFVLGFAVIGLELLTGTFYLLVIGAAVLLGGVAAWLGLSFTVCVTLTTAIAVLGCIGLRKSRFGKLGSGAPSGPNLDQGQRVAVDEWRADGSARVTYRGTQWDADLAVGASREAPLFVKEMRGNRLLLGN